MNTRLEAARAQRADLAAAARQALLRWQDGVLEGVETLATLTGTAAHPNFRGDCGIGEVVVVFEATAEEDVDPGTVEFETQEELLSVTLASARGRVRLAVGQGPRWLWENAVELWDELRRVVGQTYAAEVPVSLVLDVAERVVYCYEPWFCPDIGPEPVAIFELERAGVAPLDPFAALLASAQVDVATIERRLEELLERFDLVAPTSAGHEPGQCGLDDRVDDVDGS